MLIDNRLEKKILNIFFKEQLMDIILHMKCHETVFSRQKFVVISTKHAKN